MPDLGPDDIFDLETTALPVAFDIIWCHFPYRQQGLEPGPVARPCLVRRVYRRDTLIKGVRHAVGYVVVIYGTKQIDKFNPPRGLHVDDAEEKRACGLSVDTVFDLSDHLTLPWSPRYFSNAKGRPTISGHFTDAMKERLKAQYKQFTGA